MRKNSKTEGLGMRNKALLILERLEGLDWEKDDSEIVGLAHAYGFECAGEFTACGLDTADFDMEHEMVPFVDCPECIKVMEKSLCLCKSFKWRKK